MSPHTSQGCGRPRPATPEIPWKDAAAETRQAGQGGHSKSKVEGWDITERGEEMAPSHSSPQPLRQGQARPRHLNGLASHGGGGGKGGSKS